MQEIIALIFDFDDTLAPDSTSGFLAQCGINVPQFWQDEVQPLLKDNWDPVPAYLFKMIEGIYLCMMVLIRYLIA
jgi:hypothetical protein